MLTCHVDRGVKPEETHRRSQVLVEFVLIFPILLVFLAICVDLARMLHLRAVMGQLVHDASRYAVLVDPTTGSTPDEGQVRARIEEALPADLVSHELLVDLDAMQDLEPVVRIELRGTVTPLVPFLGRMGASHFGIAEAAIYPRTE